MILVGGVERLEIVAGLGNGGATDELCCPQGEELLEIRIVLIQSKYRREFGLEPICGEGASVEDFHARRVEVGSCAIDSHLNLAPLAKV